MSAARGNKSSKRGGLQGIPPMKGKKGGAAIEEVDDSEPEPKSKPKSAKSNAKSADNKSSPKKGGSASSAAAAAPTPAKSSGGDGLTCSGCNQSLPKTSYSGAQIKKKDARRCTACVAKANVETVD